MACEWQADSEGKCSVGGTLLVVREIPPQITEVVRYIGSTGEKQKGERRKCGRAEKSIVLLKRIKEKKKKYISSTPALPYCGVSGDMQYEY